MGWSIGYDSNWHRDIGYGVPAYCNSPDCNEKIDRGLAHVCGNEPYGGENGCGLYFCSKHQYDHLQRCSRCHNYKKPYAAKPDHPEWVKHKLMDESWEQWRKDNPKDVEILKALIS